MALTSNAISRGYLPEKVLRTAFPNTLKNKIRRKPSAHLQCAPPPFLPSLYNLGQNKKEQLTPFPSPQSNEEDAKEQKSTILASLKWGGGGWSRCSIYFVQDQSWTE